MKDLSWNSIKSCLRESMRARVKEYSPGDAVVPSRPHALRSSYVRVSSMPDLAMLLEKQVSRMVRTSPSTSLARRASSAVFQFACAAILRPFFFVEFVVLATQVSYTTNEGLWSRTYAVSCKYFSFSRYMPWPV